MLVIDAGCGTAAKECMTWPLTEPAIIDCLFLTGTTVEISDGTVQIVGWVSVAVYENERERRIVTRVALSNGNARALFAQLRGALAQGGN
jgi:hypothetical protein